MRFDKLEFDSEKTPRSPQDRPKVAKDEAYWAQKADENRRQGNYENALRYYSRALEEDKTLIAAWVGQVQMLVQLAEYPQASLWSGKALELFPNNPQLMAGQAQAECRLGNIKQAYALSDGALRQRGESAYVWQVRGEIVLAGKQNTDRHCFDKAQIADNDWLVATESALIYMFYKVFSKAQQRVQAAVERAPDAYYAWYLLGVCQSELGFDTSAQRSFQRCLELCPRHADAMHRVTTLQRPQWPFRRMLRRLTGR